MLNTAKTVIISSGIILSICVVVIAINVMAMSNCNNFLERTYRIGYYDFLGGTCYIKTNKGELVMKEKMKIVSVY
jgi:hypothetical protein